VSAQTTSCKAMDDPDQVRTVTENRSALGFRESESKDGRGSESKAGHERLRSGHKSGQSTLILED